MCDLPSCMRFISQWHECPHLETALSWEVYSIVSCPIALIHCSLEMLMHNIFNILKQQKLV